MDETVVLRDAVYHRAAPGVCYGRQMSSEDYCDCQKEAETAMRRAAATSGAERDQWVQVARAWQVLGRTSNTPASTAVTKDS
jgi:hypothetical protein